MAKPTSVLESPAFTARLRQLSPASDLAWLAALLAGVSSTLVAAYLQPGEGKFWVYAGLLLRTGIYLWATDALRGRGGETIRRLLALGLVAGSLELLVDWALIHWVANGRLVYLTGNDVVLLGSPVWMPLAWACVITELGYPALRLFQVLKPRMGTGGAAMVSTLLIGLGAGLTVGFYEYFAYRAGWWKYERAHAMIGDFCALYIPLGETLMFLPILPIAARAVSDEDRPLAAAVVGGLRFAIAIAAGYALAYVLLEVGRSPS
jgi:hypothetical protein